MKSLILGVVLGIAIVLILLDRLLRWNDANKDRLNLPEWTTSKTSRSRQGRRILLHPRNRKDKSR